jgi:hypothetical protein
MFKKSRLRQFRTDQVSIIYKMIYFCTSKLLPASQAVRAYLIHLQRRQAVEFLDYTLMYHNSDWPFLQVQYRLASYSVST